MAQSKKQRRRQAGRIEAMEDALPHRPAPIVRKVCILCRHLTWLDDAKIEFKDGKCVCLRCYEQETRSTRTHLKEIPVCQE